MRYKIATLPKKLLLPENRHVFMLIYWAIFGAVFWPMEGMAWRHYHTVVSPIDMYIPFCKWFVFPYFFWHLFIVISMLYFLFRDKKTFVEYMWFVTISYSITLFVYAVYPTQQLLRPEVKDSGILSDIVRWLYGFDTSTNVCPSLHVIGSLSVCFAVFHCKRLKNVIIRIFTLVSTLLICASTVFLKQHSIVDVFWGVVVSFAVYPLVFMKNKVSDTLIGLFLKQTDDYAICS